MKTRIINTIGILALAASIHTATAQTLPNTFSYQAVITAEDGSPVSNHDITVEVSIRQGDNCESGNSCPVLWQELHAPKTNEFGSFSIEIGDPNAISTTGGSLASYSKIDWLDTKKGNYYMQVRVDFGEASYLNGMTDLGTTKFSSVPYAIAAVTAESAKDLAKDENGKIANKIGELQDVDVNSPKKNQILVFDGTSWKNTDPAAAQGLTNIAISNPKTGDILVYNESTGNWENKVQTAPSLEKLSDVILENPTVNHVLAYNPDEKRWSNKAFTFDMIKEVSASGAKVGDVLTFTSEGLWEAQAGGSGEGGASALSGLSDVKISSDVDEGHVLRYSATDKKWKNSAPGADNVWRVDSKQTFAYASYKKIGIGTNTDKEENYAKAQLHIKDGNNNTLFNARGITIGASEIRTQATGSIALGGGNANDVQGAAVIAGTGSTSGELAKNSIVMGSGSSCSGNGDIVIGDESKAQFNNCAIFGNNLSAGYANQFICGKYNTYTDQTAVFIVGNGTSKTDTKNIFTIAPDGTVTCTGAMNSSDARLKTNINPLAYSLQNVQKLRGVTFNWNKATSPNASNKTQYGFIAQEVEKVFPDLVGTDSNGYKTVNYVGVIPVLTEAIKAQQDEIQELKSENEQLKSTLEQLLKRVEMLEKNK